MECGAALARSCGNCGTELPGAAKFCLECGTPTSGATASAESVDRSPADYTPKHLADKILTSRSALEGERKQVTVLFADVKSSMELAEQVDPEAWHRILDRFFQILTEGVHRFEGTVNQYTGDGIMALFGAPIAHEDHAQRACYAALQLREELKRYADQLRIEKGLSFGVRMGLNSGEVIVGKIGDDLRMDYTAQGQTVGLAQRLEQLASTGSAFLAGETARLVEGFFELHDLGESRIRGADAAVRVFELLGVGPHRTRLDVSRSRGLSKFVGRDDEMATLHAALERMREGHGQVVGVVAEAGAGKSRLCFEFLEQCRSQGLRIFEARGLAHGSALPFHPIRELFRSYYGIADQDPPALARQKIGGQLLLIDDSFRDTLPVIFEFLGVPDPDHAGPPMEPDARNRDLRRLLHRVTREGSGGQVTLLEDLHWWDEASLEYLAQLVEASAATGSIILVNFRPEFHAVWMQKSYYQQLPLVPLGPDAIRALLEDVLGSDPSVEQLPDIIARRTGGNPFFVEESIQALIEADHLQGTPGAYRLATAVERLPMPATVQAVLAARIDRLGEREKQVLQTGAVIGKEFSELLLAAILPMADVERTAALNTLRVGEFVYETALYPATEYAFKHPLTQEVAYASQLAETRQKIHAEAAKAIEETSADELDERAALLAHHWEHAGDRPTAADWHARAGRSSAVASEAEALHHWQQVGPLLVDEEETPARLALVSEACVRVLNLSWRLGEDSISTEDSQSLFEQGKRCARRIGDSVALADLHTTYGAVREVRFGDVPGHLELARESVRLAEASGDLRSCLDALLGLQAALSQGGQLGEAIDAADRGLAQLTNGQLGTRGLWGYDPGLALRLWRAASLGPLGRLDEARSELDGAKQAARASREHELEFEASQWQVIQADLEGDASAALEQAGNMIRMGRRFVGTYNESSGPGYLGLAHLLAGRVQDALESFGDWEQLIEQLGLQESTARFEHLPFVAEAYRRAGDWRRALELSREAAEYARGARHTRIGLPAELELARVLLEVEGPSSEAFVQARDSAAALIERTGARAFQPRLAEVDAECARRLGDADAHLEQLREAHRLYTEMSATGHAERVGRELEGLGG